MIQEPLNETFMQKRTPWQIFRAVHWALVMRELQTRFGSQNMGYVWAFADPLVMVLFMVLIRTYRRSGGESEYDIAVFLAVCIVPFNFFRLMLNQSLNAFEANRALFIYKQVKPFDTLVARFSVEFFIFFMTTVVFILIGAYYDFDMHVKNINGVILAEIWLIIFSFGVALFFAVLGTFFDLIQKIVKLASLPLFLLSGIFFPAESLPPEVRDLLLYNPLFHFMEMIHGNYFMTLDTKYVDYTYMILWTLIPFFAGLWLYIRSERRIIMT